jgi:hypothetical protein
MRWTSEDFIMKKTGILQVYLVHKYLRKHRPSEKRNTDAWRRDCLPSKVNNDHEDEDNKKNADATALFRI